MNSVIYRGDFLHGRYLVSLCMKKGAHAVSHLWLAPWAALCSRRQNRHQTTTLFLTSGIKCTRVSYELEPLSPSRLEALSPRSMRRGSRADEK